MKPIDYEKVFDLFTLKDKNNVLCKAYKQGDKYYASDGHAMIFISIDKVNLPFDEIDKLKLNFDIIKKNEIFRDEIIISELKNKLTPDFIDETKEKETECDECLGSGEVEFEYNVGVKIYYTYYDCPVCNGVGTKEIKIKNGNKIVNPLKKFKLFNVTFTYLLLKKLIDACELMQVEKIIKTQGFAFTANVFKCGDATIIIMPTSDCENATVIF